MIRDYLTSIRKLEDWENSKLMWTNFKDSPNSGYYLDLTIRFISELV